MKEQVIASLAAARARFVELQLFEEQAKENWLKARKAREDAQELLWKAERLYDDEVLSDVQ